jgi:hypothetical protein
MLAEGNNTPDRWTVLNPLYHKISINLEEKIVAGKKNSP